MAPDEQKLSFTDVANLCYGKIMASRNILAHGNKKNMAFLGKRVPKITSTR